MTAGTIVFVVVPITKLRLVANKAYSKNILISREYSATSSVKFSSLWTVRKSEIFRSAKITAW